MNHTESNASATARTATSSAPAMPILMPMIVRLDDARDVERCGRKATMLARLRHLGFDVPDGFVIPVAASVSSGELSRALASLEASVAVRSSALAEDLPDRSHAGQYTTHLGVQGVDAVREAIASCLASSGGAPMAILVQSMVPADAAGVAFSANPLTGDRDEVRVSATRGVGAPLVGGAVDGDDWSIRGERASCEANREHAIDERTALRIAELARRVEAACEGPQDIEWAVAGERLALLQARPITALPVAPRIETPKGTWQKDVARFSGPVTPYGASTNLRDEGVGDAMLEEWGLMPDRFVARTIGHELYVHVEPDGGGRPPPPWWLIGAMARLLPSLRRKLRRAREAVEQGRLERLPREWETELKPALQRRLRGWAELDLGALTDEALAEHLETLRREVHEGMSLHFRLFVPHLVGIHALAQVCRELLGWDVLRVFELLQGLSITSSAPTRDLAEVASFVRERPAARALVDARVPDLIDRMKAVDPEVSARIAGYMRTWGMRPTSSDAGAPNWEEQPHLVHDLLADLVARPPSASLPERREARVAEARASLAREADRRRFDEALSYAEIAYPLREDNVLWTDQMPTGLLRRAGLELGRRLATRGQLACAEDAAMLSADELVAALASGDDQRATASRRRAELAWVRAHPGPTTYGPAPGPPPDVRGLPEPARRLNAALLWGLELELGATTAPPDSVLAGVAASPGTCRGRVRVVHDLEDLPKLRAGEVLVCPTTTPAWTLAFHRAGALVTNVGSALSHTAIIAREHGLPAVVATVHGTSRLHDGDEVIVDGTLGTVTLTE